MNDLAPLAPTPPHQAHEVTAALPQKPLNAANYARGFLIDEEWLAGIVDHGLPSSQDPTAAATPLPPQHQSGFSAFVLAYLSGDYVSYEHFDQLEQALSFLASLKRPWSFEPISGGCGGGACDQGNCGKAGACKLGSC